ncbi:hypothetical protein J132_03719 [Termitomyces sp. J132]|nr:hypothetical protein J132_03719 [Termitomyces sp. J132]
MPWSIPLKSKSNAFPALQGWEKVRELETGTKVGIYHVGHDGKLKSHQMEAWLSSTGSRHKFGAPNTSQHMG